MHWFWLYWHNYTCCAFTTISYLVNTPLRQIWQIKAQVWLQMLELLSSHSVPYTPDSPLRFLCTFHWCIECWQWRVGCLSLSRVRTDCSRVFYWTLSVTCTGSHTMNIHISLHSAVFLLKKASSRKWWCISAFKDLWGSFYESLLTRFLGEQSVTVPLTWEL